MVAKVSGKGKAQLPDRASGGEGEEAEGPMIALPDLLDRADDSLLRLDQALIDLRHRLAPVFARHTYAPDLESDPSELPPSPGEPGYLAHRCQRVTASVEHLLEQVRSMTDRLQLD